MKPVPVVWQFKYISVWNTPISSNKEHRNEVEAAGFETRDLYAIPDGYVLVPVEITNAMADILRDHMSYQEAVMAWQDIIGLAQEESQ